MFRTVLVLGHLRGIRIQIHVSWLVIAVLLVMAMSTAFHQQYPEWSTTTALVTAVVAAMAFFASIVAHEFGHSMIAIRRGIPVTSITLFIFGGVAEVTRDSDSADDEFWIAIAGPLVSLGLSVLFAIAYALTAGGNHPFHVAVGWLALVNLVVAVFNLIPGFPLDGGRVFRALVWKVTGDASKGMSAAIAGGRLVAYGLFAIGLWSIVVVGNPIGGIWMLLIGWFLLTMAQGQARLSSLDQHLGGLRARDLATTDPPIVSAATPVDAWIQDHVLPSGRRAWMVADGDEPVGLVSMSDLGRAPREDWARRTVADIMTPLDKLVTVTADTPAIDVFRIISQRNLNQVPVLDDARLSGWIDRQRLLSELRVRMEAGQLVMPSNAPTKDSVRRQR